MLEEIQVVAYSSHPVHSVLVHFFSRGEESRKFNAVLWNYKQGMTVRLCSVKCLVSSFAVTVLLTIFR